MKEIENTTGNPLVDIMLDHDSLRVTKEYGRFRCLTPEDYHGVAKAIEVKITEARIEGMKEAIKIANIDLSDKGDLVYKRIAELKKLSKPCLCYNDQFNSECPRHN